MKINPMGKVQPLKGPHAAQQKPSTDPKGDADFATVLKASNEKVKATEIPAAKCAMGIQPSMSGLGFEKIREFEKTANRLLDTLENYQQVLANPSANLRQVQPVVDRMKAQASAVSHLAHELPRGHVVKDIIERTLMHFNKEIVRFDRGEYVDE